MRPLVSLSERYRRLFNRRGNDWWSIVFGYPVARLLLVFVEPLRWVTPASLTIAGFACKLAAAALIWTGHGANSALAVVTLLQAAQILDSMDGTLARARGQYSLAGALLDKATDAVGFAAVAIAIGRRAAAVTGEPALASLGGVAAAGFLGVCYVHWVVRAMQEPVADARSLSGSGLSLTWREIGREWLGGWKRIVRFGEADTYLWISCFALIGWWPACVIFLAVIETAGLMLILAHHWSRLRRVDRA